MVVTVLGMLTDVRSEQYLKAATPIHLTVYSMSPLIMELGIVMSPE